MSITWASPDRVAVIPGWLVTAEVSAPAVRMYALLTLYVGDDSPTHKQLGAILRVSQKAVASALAELVAVGALERGDGRSDYRLSTTPSVAQPEPPTAALPAVKHDTILAPPPLLRQTGRNVALDALCRECDIQDSSPRIAQATAALYGRRGSKGITQLFWHECHTYASRTAKLTELAELHSDSDRYARLLAEAIRSKAARIRQAQPWRESLTPLNIRDLWIDAETLPEGRRQARGLTPDEVRQIQ